MFVSNKTRCPAACWYDGALRSSARVEVQLDLSSKVASLDCLNLFRQISHHSGKCAMCCLCCLLHVILRLANRCLCVALSSNPQGLHSTDSGYCVCNASLRWATFSTFSAGPGPVGTYIIQRHFMTAEAIVSTICFLCFVLQSDTKLGLRFCSCHCSTQRSTWSFDKQTQAWFLVQI